VDHIPLAFDGTGINCCGKTGIIDNNAKRKEEKMTKHAYRFGATINCSTI